MEMFKSNEYLQLALICAGQPAGFHAMTTGTAVLR